MENKEIIDQIAYREELLKKPRLSSADRQWLISHVCYHPEFGYPYLIQDVLEFPANTSCLFSIEMVWNENPSFIAPCFLTVGEKKRNYMICKSAVSDSTGNIYIGEKIRSLLVHPASKQSQFIAFSEYGKLRIQYECTQIDNFIYMLIGSYIGKFFSIILGLISYFINTHFWIPNDLKYKYPTKKVANQNNMQNIMVQDTNQNENATQTNNSTT